MGTERHDAWCVREHGPIKDQGALRQDLLQLANLPDVQRLIVAHEKVARGADARAALQQAASYLHS